MEIHPLIYIIAFLFLARIIIWRTFPMRLSVKGFKYVHVENDGTVRELDKEEQDYLQEEFHPADGARPYIKTNYWQKTPDRKLHGFLKKNRVPWWIRIEENAGRTTMFKNFRPDNSVKTWNSDNDPFDNLTSTQ